MNRTALAALASLALTAVACASPADDSSAANDDALSAAMSTTHAVAVDFGAPDVDLDCDFEGGTNPENFSVQFNFEGRHYHAMRHIDFWGCQADRSQFKGVQPGKLVETLTKDGTVNSLTLPNGVFVAGMGTDTVTTTPITVDLRTFPFNTECQKRAGGWYITFDYTDRSFAAFGGNDLATCTGQLPTVEGQSARQARLVVTEKPTGITREVKLDDGSTTWVFTNLEAN